MEQYLTGNKITTMESVYNSKFNIRINTLRKSLELCKRILHRLQIPENKIISDENF